MQTWFLAKVKYLAGNTNGTVRNTVQQYLVDAITFTECEARLTHELAEGVKDFSVLSIARQQVSDVVFAGDTDRWFSCKVTSTIADADTGKEKKTSTIIMVNAQDVAEAKERLDERLKDWLIPWQVPMVKEMPLAGIYEYKKLPPAGFKKIGESTSDEAPEIPEGLGEVSEKAESEL